MVEEGAMAETGAGPGAGNAMPTNTGGEEEGREA